MTTNGPGNRKLAEQGSAKSRVVELLRAALQIVDQEDFPPEIGARLDHVICTVEELSD